MDKVIVYQVDGQPVSIIYPCDCGLSLEQIGQKDAPTGVPFWIVNASDLPQDRSDRDAWLLDEEQMGLPVGNGGTYKPGV